MVQNSTADHLTYTRVSDVSNSTWRHVTIEFRSGAIKVWLDGSSKIDYVIPGYEPFVGYFGFTASTGASTNWHRIDNILVVMDATVSADATTWGAVKALYR